MKHRAFTLITLIVLASLIACQAPPQPTPHIVQIEVTATASATISATPSAPAPVDEKPPYLDPSQPVAQRVADLLARMTLEEKIGQMTQVEHNSLSPADVTSYFIGSVLSGGDSLRDNSAQAWRALITPYEQAALKTRLGIPLIYGLDAIHGNGHVSDGVLFPQNIGLGATRDAGLVQQIGRATAQEVAAIGVQWNFAPVVAVPHDIRWGRTYEGYGENTALVSELGAAYVTGLQGSALSDPQSVLATPKHFIGDGGTQFGSSRQNILNVQYLLDQGDMQIDEAGLREKYLPPYQAAIKAGAKSIMVSFSSWNGTRLHAQKQLLTELLKGELGFSGFLISDWGAVDQLPGDYATQVTTVINAGLDMIMVPYQYKDFITTLTQAVNGGQVPLARIDDAVRRILTVKFELGLFEHPLPAEGALASVGSAAHRQLAREAVQKSIVVLKNDGNLLPLATDTPVIFVAGEAANSTGYQSGGWTIEWQGTTNDVGSGTTILAGIQQVVAATARVEYNRFGKFDAFTAANGQPLKADVGIVVVAEQPYAEGVGDRADLTLAANDVELIDRVRQFSRKTVVILLSGRPLIVTEHLPKWDAFVAAWLPGTEGMGVADVLFGAAPFTGQLPYAWPRWNAQLPNRYGEGCDGPLFPYGYGLTAQDSSPHIPVCPKP